MIVSGLLTTVRNSSMSGSPADHLIHACDVHRDHELVREFVAVRVNERSPRSIARKVAATTYSVVHMHTLNTHKHMYTHTCGVHVRTRAQTEAQRNKNNGVHVLKKTRQPVRFSESMCVFVKRVCACCLYVRACESVSMCPCLCDV